MHLQNAARGHRIAYPMQKRYPNKKVIDWRNTDGSPTKHPTNIKRGAITIPRYLRERVKLTLGQPVWLIIDGASVVVRNNYIGYENCERHKCLLNKSGKVRLRKKHLEYVGINGNQEITLSLPYWSDEICIERIGGASYA